MPPVPTSGGRVNALAHLSNNTAAWWWRDPGLRRLAFGISVGFAGSIAMGYDASLMTGLMANHHFMAGLDHPNATKLGVIAASQTLGSIPGVLPAAWLSDRFGRRKALAFGYIIIIAGALMQTFATGGWNMLGGRFILGFGVGTTTVAGGAYTAEIAHPRNRAQTTGLIQTCFFIGSIAAAWISFGTLYMGNTDWSWKLCVLFQIIVPIYVLAILPFVPESPRWLVSNNREEEAHAVLAKYHANGVADDELVMYELEEIKEAIAFERQAKQVSFASLFQTKANRHRLFILLTIAIMTQWAGNGVISYYLVNILRTVGVVNPAQQTGFNGGLQIWNWLFAIFGALVSERFGRRKMWLASAGGMFFSYVAITACSAAYSDLGAKSAGPAVLAFIFLFNASYSIGFTPLAVSYSLEILPYSMRTKGLSVYIFTLMSAIAFNIFVNPIALEAIAWKYYFVFLGVLMVAIGIIYFFFPETKGLMLEEVAVVFEGEAALPSHHKKDVSDVADVGDASELDKGDFSHQEHSEKVGRIDMVGRNDMASRDDKVNSLA